MPATHDMHKLARRWFRQKVRRGELPMQVQEGRLRGLIYYSVMVHGREQWLTVIGLEEPLTEIETSNRTWVAQVTPERVRPMQEADERERVRRRKRHYGRVRRRRELEE